MFNHLFCLGYFECVSIGDANIQKQICILNMTQIVFTPNFRLVGANKKQKINFENDSKVLQTLFQTHGCQQSPIKIALKSLYIRTVIYKNSTFLKITEPKSSS